MDSRASTAAVPTALCLVTDAGRLLLLPGLAASRCADRACGIACNRLRGFIVVVDSRDESGG
jgi:hypothetical protein